VFDGLRLRDVFTRTKLGRTERGRQVKRDPNNAQRLQEALVVACPYCKARIGDTCWGISSSSKQPVKKPHVPHKQRGLALVAERMKKESQ